MAHEFQSTFEDGVPYTRVKAGKDGTPPAVVMMFPLLSVPEVLAILQKQRHLAVEELKKSLLEMKVPAVEAVMILARHRSDPIVPNDAMFYVQTMQGAPAVLEASMKKMGLAEGEQEKILTTMSFSTMKNISLNICHIIDRAEISSGPPPTNTPDPNEPRGFGGAAGGETGAANPPMAEPKGFAEKNP